MAVAVVAAAQAARSETCVEFSAGTTGQQTRAEVACVKVVVSESKSVVRRRCSGAHSGGALT